MLVHFGTESMLADWTACTACMGTFDGVHLGHQAVISTAVKRANENDRPCVLVTFDRHPASVLSPGNVPPSLGTLATQLDAFRALSVDLTVVLPFNAWLSRLSAQAFLDSILVERIHAKSVVVGHDFAMGNGREGTAQWLSQYIETEIVPAFEHQGRRVSSSAIRDHILVGEVEQARILLGRPYAVEGVVIRGQRLGRTLGFPTLNLARSVHQAVPDNGVYAGTATIGQDQYMAAIAIGVRPAVERHGARTIEAYLLDYPGTSIYGRAVALSFWHKLRPEQSFESLDALVAQMQRDVESVRERMAGWRPMTRTDLAPLTLDRV